MALILTRPDLSLSPCLWWGKRGRASGWIRLVGWLVSCDVCEPHVRKSQRVVTVVDGGDGVVGGRVEGVEGVEEAVVVVVVVVVVVGT